jgi:dihydropteroate synthase
VLALTDLLSYARVPADPVAAVDVAGARIGDRPQLMGVVNRSPGSWYRESVALSTRAAVERGRRLHLEGAALVDVGAESTLSHTPEVAAEQQTQILLPVVSGLVGHGVPVSVETYHPTTAAACLAAGAAVLNVTATKEAEELYGLAADHGAAAIICYYAGGANPRDDVRLAPGEDPLAGVLEFFEAELARAAAAGLRDVILDPGAGFYYADLADGAARVRHQMRLMLASGRLRELGHPVCNALPHGFEFFGEEVRTAEGFFGVLAAIGGTSLFRTHEVRQLRAVLDCLTLGADA